MDLKQALNVLSSSLSENEKIILPVFHNKLVKARVKYPEDRTIGMIESAIEKMSSRQLSINRSELKDMYNKLYTTNTKFAEVFSEELGERKELENSVVRMQNSNPASSLVQENYKNADPILVNALNVAFGEKVKPYTKAMENNAKVMCAREMAMLNTRCSIDAVDGNSKFILCQASIETPKGSTSVYIPIELDKEKALIPSVFIGNDGSKEFNKENLENYFVSNAGKKIKIHANEIVQSINEVQGNIDQLSNVDLAVAKLNNSTQSTNILPSADNILGQRIEAFKDNALVKTAEYKNDAIDTFSKTFSSAKGIANYQFGNDKVDMGRVAVERKLASEGFAYPQISVVDCDKDTIFYAVALNGGKAAFKVPVKVKDASVEMPNVMLANGNICELKKENLDVFDSKMAASSSIFSTKNAGDIVNEVRDAVSEGNYIKAEDALNTLQEKGEDFAYTTAFQIYTDGLNGKIKTAKQTECSHMIKTANSQFNICAHTGLPVHKVYQDKNGNCLPLYRRAMEDSEDTVAKFMNAKILLT